MNSSNIVQKLWNYCSVLRDDGMSYGEYVEQLTYLLFLKMADERTRAHVQPELPGATKVQVDLTSSRKTVTSCSITTATPLMR